MMWRSLCRFACRLPQWGWSVLTVGVVLWLTLWPDPLPDNDVKWWEGTDKVVHALMFLGVYLSVCFDLSRRGVKNGTGAAGSMACLNLAGWVMLMGAVIELLQPLSGRTCDLSDFLADAVGVLTGLLLSGWLMKRLWER